MDKELRDKVLPIALRVRDWTQRKADAANFNPHNLCGWCAISAAHLFRELKRAGIDSELHYVGGHCFVVVNDYIVDVTATQFKELRSEKVFIIHHKAAQQYWFYETTEIFKYPMQLREHQIKKNWPKNEICYTR